MMSRRDLLKYAAALAALTIFHSRGVALAATAAPSDTVKGFYDTLLATMKDAKSLGFAGRRDKLAPALARAFDIPQMTRLAVGPRWQALTPQQQNDLIAAFAAFSAATYANRFNDYSGEQFEVDPKATPNADAMIVHTKLVRKSGEPVQLDYLMKSSGGGWKIVDVFLSGTVSEIATRRSEFSAVLNRGGAPALIDALHQKSVEQAS